MVTISWKVEHKKSLHIVYLFIVENPPFRVLLNNQSSRYNKCQSFSYQSSLMICATFLCQTKGAMIQSKCQARETKIENIFYILISPLHQCHTPIPFCPLLYTVGGCLSLLSYFSPETKMEMALSTHIDYYVIYYYYFI